MLNSLFGWQRNFDFNMQSSVANDLYLKSKRFVDGLFRYSVNIGIQDPWNIFSHQLDNAVEGSEAAIHNVESLSSLHNETLDRIHWRLFLRPNQKKMAGFLDEALQIILLFCKSVKNKELKKIFKMNKEFDSRISVCVSVLRSKSVAVGQEYNGTQELKSLGTGQSRIRSWGSNVAERVCFGMLLSEIEVLA